MRLFCFLLLSLLLLLELIPPCCGFLQGFPTPRPSICRHHGSCSEELVSTDAYKIRPFNSATDLEALHEICRTVFRGTDYLPSEAALYEADPACNFQNDDQCSNNETLLAVANVRALNEETGWLEAVRTSEVHRGKGYATTLISNMLHHQFSYNLKRVMACTIPSNSAMIRVFERVGMQQSAVARMSDFIAIAKLPGYRIKEAELPCQNLLDGLDMTRFIPPEAKDMSLLWEPVSDAESLQQELQQLSPDTHGMMPGVWKAMSPTRGTLLEESLELGLVYALKRSSGSSEGIFALVRDKPMPSLKSPWVLCVVGTTELHLYAALWKACFSQTIQDTLKEHMTIHKDENLNADSLKATSKSAAGFVVVVDGRIELESPDLKSRFPLREETIMIYSTTEDG